MTKPTSIYRKLTGRRRTITGYSQLWLSPDHLLLVKSTRFAEDYQRFALADIQAITVTALPDRRVLQIFSAACSAAWMLISLAFPLIYFKAFFIATGAIALALVIRDIARGERCRCFLQTAVSREWLAPVGRFKTARAFLAKIQPMIEALQGSLPIERIAAIEAVTAPASTAPPEVRSPPPYLPEILFGLYLVDAILVWGSLRYPGTEFHQILPTMLIAEAVVAVATLLRRGDRDRRVVAYIVAAFGLLCLAVDSVSVVRSVGGWFLAVQNAQRQKSAAPPLLVFSASHAWAMFASGWRVGAGVIGLAAAWIERRRGWRP